MRNILLSLVLGLAASIAQADCEGPVAFDALPESDKTALMNKAQTVRFAEGLLWKAEKDGITSYIVGTLHFYDPRHETTMERVTPLLQQTEQLFVEFNKPDENGMKTYLAENSGAYLINEGPSLIDRLGEENWAKLSVKLAERNMPGFMAARFQPWFLGITLSVPNCAIVDLRKGRLGLDKRVEQTAGDLGIPVHSLDIWDKLLPLLAGDPIDQQVEDMKWGLSLDLDDLGSDKSTVALYFREQVQLAWAFTWHRIAKTAPEHRAKISKMFSQVEKKLIIGRTRDWMDKLTPALSKSPTFVAVGAMHLPGDDGVLALLQRQGFTITRLPLSED